MTASLSEIIELDQLDINLFRSKHHRENFRKTLFGGQVLCQALAAASATVPDRWPHSLHAYFLRPGSSDIPVIYDVEFVRDGKSISSRRVVARQFGKTILNMAVSFQIDEEGFQHAARPPDVATPEELLQTRKASEYQPDAAAKTRKEDEHSSPFDIIPVEEFLYTSKEPSSPDARIWLKSNESLSDDPLVHLCALTFASDLGLLATSLLPHDATIFDPDLITASIDHAMWFHAHDFRADDWLLCSTHSPWAGNARGFSSGQIFDRSGRLVISTAQEGLIRRISEPKL